MSVFKSRGILVIEDDGNYVEGFQLALRAGGFDNPFCAVTSVEEAQHYLLGEEKYANRSEFPFPHLIVLAADLPRASRLEFLRWVRARMPGRWLPVALLGGDGNAREEAEALQAGANAYHPKALAQAELIPLMKRLVEFWLLATMPDRMAEVCQAA